MAVRSISSSSNRLCRLYGTKQRASGSFRLASSREHETKADIDNVKIQDVDSGLVYTDEADVLISATGALNNWKWPGIPGLHDFKGKLMHSAKWDESYDYSVRSPGCHHQLE